MTRDEGTGGPEDSRALPGPPPPPPAPITSGPWPPYGLSTYAPSPYAPSAYAPPGHSPTGLPAPPASSPRRRFRTRAVVFGWLGGIVVGIALAVGLMFLVLGAPWDPPGAIVAHHDTIASPEAAPKRGDCLTGGPEEADVTSRADVTGCEARHGSEVLGVVTMPAVDEPPHNSDADFFADDACRIAFRNYIGQSWDDSDLEFGAVAPSHAAWRAGDHTLFCLLDSHTFDDGRGSAKASGA